MPQAGPMVPLIAGGERPLPDQLCTLSMTVFYLWLLSDHKPAIPAGPYPFGHLDLSDEVASELGWSAAVDEREELCLSQPAMS